MNLLTGVDIKSKMPQFVFILIMIKLITLSIVILLFPLLSSVSLTCKYPFDGFGVHLGKLDAFNFTSADLRETIISLVYDDLMIRNFRTEYLPQFSTAEDSFSINCVDTHTCTWITMHSLLSQFSNVSLIVSIWSPPYYMKNIWRHLKFEYEESYYHYLTNITALIQKEYNLTVERISIANEPENMIATWDECTMPAEQLCRLVKTYNNPIISLCPENAWYSISKIYLNYSHRGIDCRHSCRTVATHGYTPSLNPFFWGTVYYDTKNYPQDLESPIWITEISSTRPLAQYHQMTEAIDMSISIVNFVGKTCVQRYYYWLTYTSSPSGESLIWGNTKTGSLTLPKKYYAYRHFTTASIDSLDYRSDCSTSTYYCLRFNHKTVFVNQGYNTEQINDLCDLCCTTENYDFVCTASNILPARSICSC